MSRSLMVLLALSGCQGVPSGEADSALVRPPPPVAVPHAPEIENLTGNAAGDACRANATAQIAGWQSQGLPTATVELKYQQALAACAGPAVDPGMAAMAGRVTLDHYRLAAQLIGRSIQPRQYLAAVRDRSRKLRRARQEPTYLAQVIAADADGDLVPDITDACPGTPELTATDRNGCTCDAWHPCPPVEAPTIDQMSQVFQTMGVMVTPGCLGAPPPAVPQPLRLKETTGPTSIYVSRVANQPAGCPVIYELRARLLPGPKYVEVRFKDSESIDNSVEWRQVFQIDPNHVDLASSRFRLWQLLYQSESVEWSVRAINGNGSASRFSAPLRQTQAQIIAP